MTDAPRTPEEQRRWREAMARLDGLLELPPPQREQALQDVDDPEQQALLERWLADHERISGVLDEAVVARMGAMAGLAGRRFGRWRLEEEIGRGGMATVYRAVSEDAPTGQQAAVKVLSLGALSQQDGVAHFLREQQVLSRMRHPGIATLFDAGLADDGTPWFAMALIDGMRIDAWCERNAPEPRARIALLLQVCEAVAYAHRNLVIHRDIKPSNVLVDEGGHARLLDFGIARLSEGLAADRTATALRALTPEYAAPEQFDGHPPSTVMDVFGLGALLYRLLAGRPPRRVVQGNVDADTLPPSRALRQDETRDPAGRGQLARHLRGDLDTIVMKALAHAQEQRYASVDALADDLSRWLSKKPIQARPPSWRYRTERFIARHRWGVLATGVVVLALAAGVAGTLWQAAESRRQAALALAAAEESQAQSDYLASLLEVLAPSTPEARERDRSEVVAEAARRARAELTGKPAVLAGVELSLGDVAERVGDYPQAAALYDSALALRRQHFGDDSSETAEALASSGAIRLRFSPPQFEEADQRLRQAVAVLRARAPDDPRLVRALMNQAEASGNRDRYPQATAALGEADAICRNVDVGEVCEMVWLNQGMLHLRQQRTVESVHALERAHEARRRRLGEDHAKTLFAAGLLGEAYTRHGRHTDAVALLERVYATQQRIYAKPTQETLRTLNHLIGALQRANQTDRALELHARYQEHARQLFGERHAEVAMGFASLGNLLFSEARFDEAEQAYARSLAIYTDIEGPDGAAALILLGNRADALSETGRAREALPLQHRALTGMEKLFGGENLRIAARYSRLARTELLAGRVDQALVHYDRAVALYRKLESPEQPSSAIVGAGRARALFAAGRTGEAATELRAYVKQIDASPGRTDRAYWESYAFLVEAACANRAADCGSLRDGARSALGKPLPGIAHMRLEQALTATQPR